LLRLADITHPQHSVAHDAVRKLRTERALIRTLPQSFFEFWTVATRDSSKNGLGLTAVNTDYLIQTFTVTYWPVPDDPTILANWRRLVVRYNVAGKSGHDARYIAAMQAHGITHILTFDSDFNRYIPEGIVIVNPVDLVASNN